MIIYQIPVETIALRYKKVVNARGKYAFGGLKRPGSKEAYNIDQAITILNRYSGKAIPRAKLLQAFSNKFQAIDSAKTTKASFMVQWFTKNKLIKVIWKKSLTFPENPV